MDQICPASDPRDPSKFNNNLDLSFEGMKNAASDQDWSGGAKIGIATGSCWGLGDDRFLSPQVYLSYGLPVPDALHSLSTGVRLTYTSRLFSDSLGWSVSPSLGTRYNFNGDDLSGLRGLVGGIETAAFWQDKYMHAGPRAGIQADTAGDYGFTFGLEWGWNF